MFDGKRFFPETGMPILKMARRTVVLAVELPEPFFVPTMIEKSLTTLFMRLLIVVMSLRASVSIRRRWSSSQKDVSRPAAPSTDRFSQLNGAFGLLFTK